MLRDLKSQFDVIRALTIWDMQGLMKSYNYGFAWALLEPIMFITIVRVARSAFSGLTPPDMPPATFLIAGIVPFYMYNAVLSTVYVSASSSSNLLGFPRVTPIDIAIASALSDFCVFFTLFWILIIPASIIEHVWPPENAAKILLVFSALWTLGVALGLIVAAAIRVFPPMKEFISYYSLINRMIGGMLYVITMFPTLIWPWLTWNPVLHCMEMMRDAWFVTYTSPIASPGYVIEWILGLLLLGLSLERFQRRMPYV